LAWVRGSKPKDRRKNEKISEKLDKTAMWTVFGQTLEKIVHIIVRRVRLKMWNGFAYEGEDNFKRKVVEWMS